VLKQKFLGWRKQKKQRVVRKVIKNFYGLKVWKQIRRYVSLDLQRCFKKVQKVSFFNRNKFLIFCIKISNGFVSKRKRQKFITYCNLVLQFIFYQMFLDYTFSIFKSGNVYQFFFDKFRCYKGFLRNRKFSNVTRFLVYLGNLGYKKQNGYQKQKGLVRKSKRFANIGNKGKMKFLFSIKKKRSMYKKLVYKRRINLLKVKKLLVSQRLCKSNRKRVKKFYRFKLKKLV